MMIWLPQLVWVWRIAWPILLIALVAYAVVAILDSWLKTP